MAQSKRQQLERLAEQVRALDLPLYKYRQENDYLPVFGEGNPDARIMFIGEAPGLDEARAGRPFVGRAGRVYDELLAGIGLSREDVYITNVVKDRPPGNRSPRMDEVAAYAPFLARQIEIIQPRVLVPLGSLALQFVQGYLGLSKSKIGEVHGKVICAHAVYGPVSVVPLYHPAAVFYKRQLRGTLAEDFQVLHRL